MLRQYRGLKSYGYGVTTKAVSYEPFKLTLTFREAPDENCISNQMPYKTTPSVNSSMLLVISATPVKSVYKSKYIILLLIVAMIKLNYLFHYL